MVRRGRKWSWQVGRQSGDIASSNQLVGPCLDNTYIEEPTQVHPHDEHGGSPIRSLRAAVFQVDEPLRNVRAIEFGELHVVVTQPLMKPVQPTPVDIACVRLVGHRQSLNELRDQGR